MFLKKSWNYRLSKDKKVEQVEFKVQAETQSRTAMSDIHGVYVRAGVLFSNQKDQKNMECSWTVGDFPVP